MKDEAYNIYHVLAFQAWAEFDYAFSLFSNFGRIFMSFWNVLRSFC